MWTLISIMAPMFYHSNPTASRLVQTNGACSVVVFVGVSLWGSGTGI